MPNSDVAEKLTSLWHGRLQRAELFNAGSWYRAADDLRSDASRAIDLAWKRYHNGIGRFHPEREVTTGAAKFKLRHYLCSKSRN